MAARRPLVVASSGVQELPAADTLTANVVTQSANDNSTKVASTAYADAKVANALGSSTTIAPSQAAVAAGAATLTPLAAVASGLIAGQYYTPLTSALKASQILLANNALGARMIPARSTNITSLAITITTAGSAGSVIRLGIYQLDAANTGTLVADFGTVVGTSVTTQVKTGTAAVVAGNIYWVVAVGQGSPTTQPIVTCCTASDPGVPGTTTPSTAITASLAGLQSGGGTTGALPGTQVATPAGSNVACVAFMAAA